MAACSPHRFYANDRNLLRDAVLTPSAVLAVENQVRDEPRSREGTAQLEVTGAYAGVEEALYEVEVTGTEIDERLVSAPVFSGAGSGRLEDVSASGTPQTYTIELANAGAPEAAAGVDVEGVRIVARSPGPDGNALCLAVDQSGLSFAATIYSLLADLALGAGSDAVGLEGQAYDWDTKAVAADDQIPADAHRVAFGDDTSHVYLAYKRYTGDRWLYHFVPEIKVAVPAGTPIKFVSGGRAVSVLLGGSAAETFPGIVTAFDLLDAIKTSSTLLDVSGVVANDRTPTGQAARELQLRTDAHAEPSTGSGSTFATKLIDVRVAADAPTEQVTFQCFAVSDKDAPLAGLGSEQWRVSGSLSGELLEVATTGIPFEHPDGRWGATVPQKFPPAYGTPKGKFDVVAINYVSRTTEEGDPPPICMVAMELGPNAVDETVTLKYTRRPSGDCDCSDLPIPSLSEACLGLFVQGDDFMEYSAANRARLIALYEWAAGTVRAVSEYSGLDALQYPFVSAPSPLHARTFNPKSLLDVIAAWERTLQSVNGLAEGMSPDIRGDAETAWDTAVAEFEADLDPESTLAQQRSYLLYENVTAGDAVCIFTDNDGIKKARLAIPNAERYGFVIANATAGGSTAVDVYFYGVVPGRGISDGVTAYMDKTSAGAWTETAGDAINGGLEGVTHGSELIIARNFVTTVYYAVLSDRYLTRMNAVLMTGGISPLGKSEASILESGDGCWQDYGDEFFWTVVGSEKGAYGWAFTNRICYSVRKASARGAYYATKEFGFQINVVEACVSKLKEGDEIVLSINGAGWPPAYQVGDKLSFGCVAASPLCLAGGRNAIRMQRWYVSGDVDGALPPLDYDPEASSPGAYDAGGIAFTLVPGAVPFALGDRFVLTVEGGAWRWRKTIAGEVGAWSSVAGIPSTAILLDDGLSIRFIPGAAPSFVVGETFAFRALQPWAASNVRAPGARRWKWGLDAATIEIDLGSEQTISGLVIAQHTLPEGAALLWEGGTTLSGLDLSAAPDWNSGAIVLELAEPWTARYLRLTLAYADGAAIGWLWAGVPFATVKAARIPSLRRQYLIGRDGAAALQGGNFMARAVGAVVEWPEGALLDEDLPGLDAMLDWVKTHNDEPLVFVPQITRPGEALTAHVVEDEIDVDDAFAYGPDAGHRRRLSATLRLAGSWTS